MSSQRVAALAQPGHDLGVADRRRRPRPVVLRDQALARPAAQRGGGHADSRGRLLERHRSGRRAVTSADGCVRHRLAPSLLPGTVRRAARAPRARPGQIVGGGASTSTRPRRPRAKRPAASAVGARHVSGGASRRAPQLAWAARSRSGLLPISGVLGLLASARSVNAHDVEIEARQTRAQPVNSMLDRVAAPDRTPADRRPRRAGAAARATRRGRCCWPSRCSTAPKMFNHNRGLWGYTGVARRRRAAHDPEHRDGRPERGDRDHRADRPRRSPAACGSAPAARWPPRSARRPAGRHRGDRRRRHEPRARRRRASPGRRRSCSPRSRAAAGERRRTRRPGRHAPTCSTTAAASSASGPAGALAVEMEAATLFALAARARASRPRRCSSCPTCCSPPACGSRPRSSGRPRLAWAAPR